MAAAGTVHNTGAAVGGRLEMSPMQVSENVTG